MWPKKYADAYGTFLSDADTAWMNRGCGVYLSNVINPASFQAEKCHPTQKPVPRELAQGDLFRSQNAEITRLTTSFERGPARKGL